MISLRRPTRAAINAFLADQASRPFTYQAVGTSAGAAPAGYDLDERRIELGRGEETFARAAAAVRAWRHFQLGWVEPCWADTPIEAGCCVGILARVLGMWWLNACRIVEVLDTQSPSEQTFGFVYGTLPDHAERGEERFVVTWNRTDDRVGYTIRAFSQPRHPLARLGYPLVRRFQKRFARDSCAAMRRAVGSPAAGTLQ